MECIALHYNNGTPISALSLRAHCTSILTSAARAQHKLKAVVENVNVAQLEEDLLVTSAATPADLAS